MELEMLPTPTKTTAPSGDGIRVLTAEEIQTLEPIFRAAGSSLPHPSTSQFIGCVKDGKVVGFGVLQLRLHAEPFHIEEGHSDCFLPIVKAMESVIITQCGPQWVYVFAPAGRVAQLAQSVGLQMEPWVVLSKLVTPESPSMPVVDLPVDPQLDLPIEGGPIQ